MSKVPISIRIDKEILDWFRNSTPVGYQTLINQVLRSYRETAESRSVFVLGRAQEIFRRFHARCFWHLDQNLVVTTDNLHIVRQGLRKHGGREGYLLAAELDPSGKKAYAD